MVARGGPDKPDFDKAFEAGNIEEPESKGVKPEELKTEAAKLKTKAEAIKRMGVETGDGVDLEAIRARELAKQKPNFMAQFPDQVREAAEKADKPNIEASLEWQQEVLAQSPDVRNKLIQSSLEEAETPDTQLDRDLYAKSGGSPEGLTKEDVIEHSFEETA